LRIHKSAEVQGYSTLYECVTDGSEGQVEWSAGGRQDDEGANHVRGTVPGRGQNHDVPPLYYLS